MIKEKLIEKLENKTANIAVLGLGYVGLPFASVFAEAGIQSLVLIQMPARLKNLTKGSAIFRMFQLNR